MASAAGFHSALRKMFLAATKKGAPYVDVQAGKLHRQVGGYPGRNHRMPACCGAMHAEMRSGDWVLTGPPKGQGASLTIRYIIPRP